MNSNTTLKVDCLCLFDITSTGVNSHQRNISFPYQSKTGAEIKNDAELHKARNQQRNFDTLQQLIGLRTQVTITDDPAVVDNKNIPEFAWAGRNAKVWKFSFEVESQAQWLIDNDELWLLKNDSDRTPMLLGLEETAMLDSCISTQGDKPNTVYYVNQNK